MSVCFCLQAARTVLHSAEPVSQMLTDWKQIDFEGISRQALWTFSQSIAEDYELINERKYTHNWFAALFWLDCISVFLECAHVFCTILEGW